MLFSISLFVAFLNLLLLVTLNMKWWQHFDIYQVLRRVIAQLQLGYWRSADAFILRRWLCDGLPRPWTGAREKAESSPGRAAEIWGLLVRQPLLSAVTQLAACVAKSLSSPACTENEGAQGTNMLRHCWALIA